MPFTRRQSRLASQNATVPEPPTQDASTPSLHMATPKRGAFAFLNSITHRTPKTTGAMRVTGAPKTPKEKSPIKPTETEMHPQQHHRTSATPNEEARWLGLFNMGAQTAPARQSTNSFTAAQTTPTPARVSPPTTNVVSPPGFEFTFRRAPSVELSENAQKIMAESREEAAKIRAQLAAALPSVPEGEPGNGFENAVGRKIAKPKGKAGRYSDLHKQDFRKMDSIANHASAWRADPSRSKAAVPLQPAASTSLKRSPSKADLDKPTTPVLARSPSKPDFGRPTASSLRRSPSKPALTRLEPNPFISKSAIKAATARMMDDKPEAPSAKRVKHAKEDDAGTTRPIPREVESPSASPRPRTAFSVQATPGLIRSKSGLLRPGFSSAMGPTKASMARTHSAHMSVDDSTMIPSLPRSTTSNNLHSPQPVVQSGIPRSKSMKDLSAVHTPTHSPLKVNVTAPTPTTAKTAMFRDTTPIKAPYELTTSSPDEEGTPKRIKSILRTPNRRYTRDPLKIAAGTHHSTPPRQTNFYPTIPATDPARKHVEFTASTKTQEGMKAASVEPQSVTYPDLGNDPHFNRRQTLADIPSMPGSFTFRSDKEMAFNSPKTSTIRQVRTSDVCASPFSFRGAQPMSPNKRKLDTVGEAEESEKENNGGEDEQRPAKKARMFSSSKSAPTTPAREGVAKSKLPMFRGKRTSGLSAARLSMLARPKRRA